MNPSLKALSLGQLEEALSDEPRYNAVAHTDEKKPAHRERVNPSFERLEETGVTILNRWQAGKFLFPITNIAFVNDTTQLLHL
jgi:hypothetical protein